MQSPFPTKKFFVVLLFLAVVALGAFKLFGFLSARTAQKAIEEQKLAIVQNELLPSLQNNVRDATLVAEQTVATSTLNAVAVVAYLNEQTKANGRTMEEITADVGKKIQTAKEKLDADAYSKNDILTDNDNSPEAIKNYANVMGGIFITYGREPQSESYLEIIKKALETKNPKEFKKLDPYIAFYQNIIRDSLSLAAPTQAASVHLHIINGYAEMLALIQGFQTTFDDVPLAVASYSRLEKASSRFIDSFKEADALFKQNGVVFFPNENGNIFADVAK
jgi:hypothetical protein